MCLNNIYNIKWKDVICNEVEGNGNLNTSDTIHSDWETYTKKQASQFDSCLNN